MTNAIISKSLSLVTLLSAAAISNAAPQYTLDQSVSIAQQQDPWLRGSEFRQQATEAKSIAAGQLPDPVVSLSFANLPTDSFDVDQEPMTQFKVGVKQAIPRGDSLALKQDQLAQMSAQQPYMRQDRRAKVAVTVGQLWLEAFRSQETIRLIEKDRSLFEHLVDVAQVSYASAGGKTRQQDLVRAQLELTRLEDRLTKLRQQKESTQASLGEWLMGPEHRVFEIAPTLPDIKLVGLSPVDTRNEESGSRLPSFLWHPAIKAIDQKIQVGTTGIELAKQKYKPQWGINASYGYRDEDPMGNDRADFFSVGVSFDLPLFTEQRQDRELQSAVAQEAAIRTEKALKLRSMRADYEAASAELRFLNQRYALYQDRLLEEIHDQAEASLTAYTNDTGDFAEVVRARIAELNANIDFLNIKIDRLKAILQLNYFSVSTNGNDTEGSKL